MSWFPKFLSPGAAAIAAAIFVPALLALYFLKLRRKEVAVSSTFLWKKAIRDLQVNAPFQKLRKNLLLFLQLLLLLFLILAISRPVSNYKPGPGKTAVILIDRSASMSARDQEGGKTRLDEAKRRAKELVAAMGKDSVAMVIAFDDTARLLQPFTGDAQLLAGAIDSIQPTDRPTSLKAAYQLADAQMNFDPEQLRPGAGHDLFDVRVFSDGRAADAAEASIKGQVTYEKVGSDAAANVAVVALSASRTYGRPTQVEVFAKLANFGPEPVAVPVRLTVDGEPVKPGGADFQAIYLLPERWATSRRPRTSATRSTPTATPSSSSWS